MTLFFEHIRQCTWLSLALIMLSLPSYAKPNAPAPQEKTTILAAAQREFAEGQYDKARENYRKYLRKFVRDADAWSQLGVTVYYCGEPEKSLRILKKWEAQSTSKSYNQYHQGLVLLSLNEEKKAAIALAKAARFVDEYGARATFELAILEYNNREPVKTQYWINLYKQRYPQGAYLPALARLEQSQTAQVFLGPQQGNRRPTREASLLKFHPYSLSKVLPHYWFFQLGFLYTSGDVVDPDLQAGTKPGAFEKQDLLVRTGIGLGPIQRQELTSYFGYTYTQDWITSTDRLTSYIPFDQASDIITNWPFRPDLLERTHRVYSELSYEFPKYASIGMDIFQEYAFIGSRVIPVSNGSEAEQYSAQTKEANLLRPYVSSTINQIWNITFYLYMYKQVELLQSDQSFKTYSFSDSPVFSFGLNQILRVPSYKLLLNFDVFQFDYIYNDYWEDYTRFGLIAGGETEIDDSLRAGFAVGYYEDTYQLPLLRMGSCKFAKRDTKAGSDANSSEVQSCPRKDTGMMYRGLLTYDHNAFTRSSLQLTMINNSNPTLAIYAQSELIVEFNISMAFPNNERVTPFIQKFGDILRTKRSN